MAEPSGGRSAVTLTSHWLVLALAIARPSHAYEIGRRYERCFGSFAAMSLTAVYGALDRLSEHGLVSKTTVPGPPGSRGTRSQRVIYAATSAGVQAHKQWLLSRIRPRQWRIELLARIATGATLEREQLLYLIGLYERAAQEQLARIEKPPLTVGGIVDLRVLHRWLAAEEEIAVASAQLRWVMLAHEALASSDL